MKYLKVWTSFREVLAPLTDAEKGRLFCAMLEYAEVGTIPELEGNERFIWPAAKQSIDLAAEKAEKLRENGMRGGRPKNQNKPEETKENQTEPDKTDDNQAEAEKKRKEKKGKEKGKNQEGNILSINRFIQPTVEDVQKYCEENDIFGFNAERFIDYYEARGWMIGKNKIKNWKACIRTWLHNEEQRRKEEKEKEGELEGLPY